MASPSRRAPEGRLLLKQAAVLAQDAFKGRNEVYKRCATEDNPYGIHVLDSEREIRLYNLRHSRGFRWFFRAVVLLQLSLAIFERPSNLHPIPQPRSNSAWHLLVYPWMPERYQPGLYCVEILCLLVYVLGLWLERQVRDRRVAPATTGNQLRGHGTCKQMLLLPVIHEPESDLLSLGNVVIVVPLLLLVRCPVFPLAVAVPLTAPVPPPFGSAAAVLDTANILGQQLGSYSCGSHCIGWHQPSDPYYLDHRRVP